MLPPGQKQTHCGSPPVAAEVMQSQLVLLGRVLGSQEGDGEGDGVGVGVGVGDGLEHGPMKNSGQVCVTPLLSRQASSMRSSIEHVPKGSLQPASTVVKASSLHKQV